MALNKFNSVTLNFNGATEYSLDSGATWTALAANTEKIVTDAEMDNQYNGRVKVRSTGTVTTINYTTMKFATSSYRSVHLRNGSSVTTLLSSFTSLTAEHLRLDNMIALTTLQNAFAYSNIGVIHDMVFPICTNGTSMNYRATIGYFGKLTAPQLVSMYQMFREATINHIGSIYPSVANAVDIRFAMLGLKSGSYPNIQLNTVSGNFNNYATDNTHPSTVVYGLYTKFQINNHSSSSAYRFLDRTSIQFCGYDLKLTGSGATTGIASSPNGSFDDSASLFSALSFDTASSDNASTTLFTVNAPGWSTTLINDIRTNTTAVSAKFDWIPIGRTLKSYNKDGSVPFGKSSYFGNNVYSGWVDTNGDVYESTSCGGLQHTNTFEVTKTLPSDKAWFSQIGTYAVQSGADILVYDVSDNLLTTVTGVTASHIDISTDGSLMTVTEAGQFVSQGVDITTTITIYNVTTGNVVASKIITAPDNVVIGTYQPYSTSKFNLVYNVYVGGTVSSTVVDNYTDITLSNKTVTYTLPNIMTHVYHSFSDSCEFYTINNIDGKIEWLFTS